MVHEPPRGTAARPGGRWDREIGESKWANQVVDPNSCILGHGSQVRSRVNMLFLFLSGRGGPRGSSFFVEIANGRLCKWYLSLRIFSCTSYTFCFWSLDHVRVQSLHGISPCCFRPKALKPVFYKDRLPRHSLSKWVSILQCEACRPHLGKWNIIFNQGPIKGDMLVTRRVDFVGIFIGSNFCRDCYLLVTRRVLKSFTNSTGTHWNCVVEMFLMAKMYSHEALVLPTWSKGFIQVGRALLQKLWRQTRSAHMKRIISNKGAIPFMNHPLVYMHTKLSEHAYMMIASLSYDIWSESVNTWTFQICKQGAFFAGVFGSKRHIYAYLLNCNTLGRSKYYLEYVSGRLSKIVYPNEWPWCHRLKTRQQQIAYWNVDILLGKVNTTSRNKVAYMHQWIHWSDLMFHIPFVLKRWEWQNWFNHCVKTM